jgi:hypothetical protein
MMSPESRISLSISSEKRNAETGTTRHQTRVTARIFAIAVGEKPAPLAHGCEWDDLFEDKSSGSVDHSEHR